MKVRSHSNHQASDPILNCICHSRSKGRRGNKSNKKNTENQAPLQFGKKGAFLNFNIYFTTV